uniref:long-chain-fatty-acid--CoA ligase n=1 Tax=Leptobrachium leishanense TaxID=445787 RepID=A0A8C5RAS1_9ANUR
MSADTESQALMDRSVHASLDDGEMQTSTDRGQNLTECDLGPSEYPDGGWCLAPADALWTVRRYGAVKLRTGHSSERHLPLTVPQFFSHAVRRWNRWKALSVKRAGKWTKITYAEYESQTRSVARALLQLGLQLFHGVLILGSTSPEWFMAEIGSILAGGLAVGVDPSCSASFCQEVAIRSKAQVVIVQDPGQLEKILQVLDNLPQVKAIIQCEGQLEASKFLFTWDAFLALGTDLDDVCLNEVMESQKANQCCAVMYAAGVTEDVRGVMLSHDNITWMARSVCDHLNLGPNEVVVSYQPLNDMTVQLMDLWLPLCCGGTTYFADSNDPESSLISVLCHARPTIFLGCHAFWETVKRRLESLKKIEMLQKVPSNEQIHINLLRQARGRLLEHVQTLDRKTCVSWRDYMDKFFQLPLNFLSKLLVSNPACASLGLNHCTFCYSGTSVVPSETMDFFGNLGLKILQLYGLNESCGMHSIGHPNDPIQR